MTEAICDVPPYFTSRFWIVSERCALDVHCLWVKPDCHATLCPEAYHLVHEDCQLNITHANHEPGKEELLGHLWLRFVQLVSLAIRFHGESSDADVAQIEQCFECAVKSGQASWPDLKKFSWEILEFPRNSQWFDVQLRG